jgi:hypothetical protein
MHLKGAAAVTAGSEDIVPAEVDPTAPVQFGAAAPSKPSGSVPMGTHHMAPNSSPATSKIRDEE